MTAVLSQESEWSGTIVGVSNAVTRTRGTVQADRALDEHKCAHFVELARRRLGGYHAYVCDAVIHGVRARLFTDSHHLADFWGGHWYGQQEWRERTGLAADERPSVTVYAASGIAGREASAFVCGSTVVVVNTAWYGTVRDETLGAVRRVLAEERGAHLVRASSVVQGGRATLVAGAGRTTGAFARMESVGARFQADDAVVVRYAWRRKSGGWVSPESVGNVRGWRAFAASGDVRGVTEQGWPIELPSAELDTGELRAFVYPAERRAYVRTDLLQTYPHHAWTVLRSRMENAPESGMADDELARRAASVSDPAARNYFSGLPAGRLREMLGRLVGFEGTRALVDAEDAFGRSRTIRNPWEPVALGAVIGSSAPVDEGDAELWKLLQRRGQ